MADMTVDPAKVLDHLTARVGNRLGQHERDNATLLAAVDDLIAQNDALREEIGQLRRDATQATPPA